MVGGSFTPLSLLHDLNQGERTFLFDVFAIIVGTTKALMKVLMTS